MIRQKFIKREATERASLMVIIIFIIVLIETIRISLAQRDI